MDVADLESEWKPRVAEILQLTSDPLLTTLGEQPTLFSEYILKLSIENGVDMDFLPTLAASKGNLEDAVRTSFLKHYKPRAPGSSDNANGGTPSGSRPERTPNEQSDQAARIATEEMDVDTSIARELVDRDTAQTPLAEAHSLASGHKRTYSDAHTESFGLKIEADNIIKRPNTELILQAQPPKESLANLDIIIAPEHYPTHPHAVSSLSELYYLTQTLPLIKLLPGSHKALLTENFELALLEGKIAVLYSRIEELKRQGKWSLRQPIKYCDPLKKDVTSHWDSVLMEGRWMATDFHEGNKFKKATCVLIAQAIHDYWTYGKEVCIVPRPIRYLDDDIVMQEATSGEIETQVEPEPTEPKEPEGSTAAAPVTTEEPTAEPFAALLPSEAVDVEMNDASATESVPVPGNDEAQDLPSGIVADRATESGQEQETNTEEQSLDPQALATVAPETVVEEPQGPMFIPQKRGDVLSSGYPFRLNMDYSDLPRLEQSIFTHLPKLNGFDSDEILHPKPPLTTKNSPMVPVSRLIYPFEEDNMWYKLVVKESPKAPTTTGPPEYQKGLFGVNAHRRFNFLKPPRPPLIKNIEYRLPTIWLPEDDKQLIHYVAEFCFNWEVISEHLLSPTPTLKRYESNIERRTPWQCFERYIQLNEKFQFSDMKGIYAHHAQKWLEHAHGAQLTTKRRISPLGVGNESIQRGHRRLRWASMFDAMRKSMRKREIALSKLNKKKNEASSGTPGPTPAGTPTQKRPPDRMPTPLELSKLKFERDKSIHEAYVNQQATRLRMMAAVAQQKRQDSGSGDQEQVGPRQQTPNVGPLSQTPGPSSAGQNPGGLNTSGQARPQVAAPSQTAKVQAGQRPTPPQQRAVPMKRPTSPNGTPFTTEQIQQILLKRRQGQGSPMSGMAAQNAGQMNQMGQGSQMGQLNQMAQLNQPASGGASPQMNRNMALNQGAAGQKSTQPGQAPSPNARYNQVQPSNNSAKSRIHFAPAQVSAIINSIQNKNPNLTKEQVTKLAATYLANIQQQQQSRINQQQQGPPQAQTNAAQVQIRKQPQVANLTPQERLQLQLLKSRKSASGGLDDSTGKSSDE